MTQVVGLSLQPNKKIKYQKINLSIRVKCLQNIKAIRQLRVGSLKVVTVWALTSFWPLLCDTKTLSCKNNNKSYSGSDLQRMVACRWIGHLPNKLIQF